MIAMSKRIKIAFLGTGVFFGFLISSVQPHKWSDKCFFILSVWALGYLLYWMLKQQTFGVVHFSINTLELVQFYLTKKKPISKELFEKVITAIRKNKHFVHFLSIKIEMNASFTRVKNWKTRYQIEGNETIDYTSYEESDGCTAGDEWLWEFSLKDYLNDLEYQQVVPVVPKDNSFFVWERIRIDLKDGEFRIFGEFGRFGKTIEQFEGYEHGIAKPENFMLTLSPRLLSRLKFTKEKKGKDLSGRVYRKGKGIRQWEVCGKDSEIPWGWSYSIRIF